jgi:hypothetical protein
VATNKYGQYTYEKGDGIGGFLLDLVTKDAANVKQRQQTIRRIADGVSNTAQAVVAAQGQIIGGTVGAVAGVANNALNIAGGLGQSAIAVTPGIVQAVAPALPAIARAAAPFVGGVGGAILGALGARGPAAPAAPAPAPAPAPAENNTGLWLGMAALFTVGAFAMRGGDKK